MEEGLRPLPIDVVSVQSQVVYGAVGNNVALPALQAHGLRVAVVPTVVFSNTPHYPSFHGGALPVDWFEGYLQGLIDRGALRSTRAVLVGYLGGPGQGEALSRWFDRVRSLCPGLRVIVDPVIGDDDSGIYVDPRMVGLYRERLLSQACGLTPNGFELGCLTGRPVGTMEQVVEAARTLLSGRTEWVVVTSAAPAAWRPGQMQLVLVTRESVQVVRHPRIDAAPKGTGDLFSAELTARWLAGRLLPAAVRQASRQVVAAIARTHDARCAELMLPLARRRGGPASPLV